MNKIIIIVVAAIVLLGCGAGIYFFMPFNSNETSSAPKEEKEIYNLAEITFVQLPEILVNLKSGKNGPNILKAIFILELTNEKDKDRIDRLKPLIVDQCQTYLRELEVSDLQGAIGLERIRQEIKSRVSNLVAPAQIRQVLYKDFLVQ